MACQCQNTVCYLTCLVTVFLLENSNHHARTGVLLERP